MPKIVQFKLIDGINYKQCSLCKKFFIANHDFYYPDLNTSSKLTSRCILCIKHTNKIHYDLIYKRSNHISWDKKKLKEFEKLYLVSSNAKVAEYFNTTIKSVESIACRLKIVKPISIVSKIHKEGQHNKGRLPIYTDYNGFIQCYMPEHPFCGKSGYVGVSRLIMEEKLGRYLTCDEIILHKNNIKDDNDIDNLEIKSFYRSDVTPLQILNDRNNGMTIKQVREKYKISINTYYRKIGKIIEKKE